MDAPKADVNHHINLVSLHQKYIYHAVYVVPRRLEGRNHHFYDFEIMAKSMFSPLMNWIVIIVAYKSPDQCKRSQEDFSITKHPH